MAYRILRSIKNRYGSTSEICVFEMSKNGLEEILSPSALMLSGRSSGAPGSCAACVLQGSRPILTEVQALVTKTVFGLPRRVATGFDYNRLCLILAVLEKRAGFYFSTMDVYLNVVGGIRLEDPASDLPVALSLISALKDKIINQDVIAFGEIGLSGEIRGAKAADRRVREAYNLGFKLIITPVLAKKIEENIEIKEFKNIKSVISFFK